MIRLKDIDINNWYDCTKIQITEDQSKIFTFPVVYWIAECKYRKDFHELSIYEDETLIGFTVWGYDNEAKEYWIIALLIDKKYQNKGYGKQAINEIIDFLSKREDCKKIFIGYKPANSIAERVYSKLGFVDTGRRENEEIIRCLTL